MSGFEKNLADISSGTSGKVKRFEVGQGFRKKLEAMGIASEVLTMYFPCITTFTVLVKELGIKDMIKATLIMIISTMAVGGFLNFVL